MRNIIISSLLATSLISGGSLGYNHFKKDITLVVDGKKKEISTFTGNVEELLIEQEVKYDTNDIINLPLDTKLTDGMNVEVTDVMVKIEKESKVVDFETEIVKDREMKKGTTSVSVEGKNGENELVYEVTYHNGKQVGKKFIEENVITNPVNKVAKEATKEEIKGEEVKEVKIEEEPKIIEEPVKEETTKEVEQVKETSESSEVSNLGTHMVVESTSYCQGSVTATGTQARWGVIAVDPNVIPFGTKVYIPQFDKVFIAEDTGGAIKGNKIDIFMENSDDAINWGRRNIDIYILK